MISYETFEQVEIRIGTIIEAKVFEGVKIPAYQLVIDFGEFGIKSSSSQITDRYTLDQLIGRQICAVVNLAPKKVKGFVSEVLVLWIYHNDEVVLVWPDDRVDNWAKVY